MKKTITILVVTFMLLSGVRVHAQDNNVDPGILPSSPFHFLDRLVERVQVAFTKGVEAKTKLEVKFAEERIAEIKYEVEKKGINALGLQKAKKHLRKNLAKVEDKKSKVIEKAEEKGLDLKESFFDIFNSVDSEIEDALENNNFDSIDDLIDEKRKHLDKINEVIKNKERFKRTEKEAVDQALDILKDAQEKASEDAEESLDKAMEAMEDHGNIEESVDVEDIEKEIEKEIEDLESIMEEDLIEDLENVEELNI